MAKTKHLIYKATSPSGKSYIGMTTNFHKRKCEHKGKGRRGVVRPFYKTMRKYGYDYKIAKNYCKRINLKGNTEALYR